MPIAPLKPEDQIFVQFQTPRGGRILHAGRVLETDPAVGVRVRLRAHLEAALCDAAPDQIKRALEDAREACESDSGLEEPLQAAIVEPLHPFAIEPGQVAFLYFVWNQRFSQQPGRVAEVSTELRGLKLALTPTGKLCSAESRQCYRASALSADLWALLGPDLRCEILDVSATGFAAYVPSQLPPGSLVEVTIQNGEQCVSGLVSVQNLRRTEHGRIRCGFHCIDDPHRNQLLLRALPRINMELQRIELARRAGLDVGSAPAQFMPRRMRR